MENSCFWNKQIHRNLIPFIQKIIPRRLCNKIVILLYWNEEKYNYVSKSSCRRIREISECVSSPQGLVFRILISEKKIVWRPWIGTVFCYKIKWSKDDISKHFYHFPRDRERSFSWRLLIESGDSVEFRSGRRNKKVNGVENTNYILKDYRKTRVEDFQTALFGSFDSRVSLRASYIIIKLYEIYFSYLFLSWWMTNYFH